MKPWDSMRRILGGAGQRRLTAAFVRVRWSLHQVTMASKIDLNITRSRDIRFLKKGDSDKITSMLLCSIMTDEFKRSGTSTEYFVVML